MGGSVSPFYGLLRDAHPVTLVPATTSRDCPGGDSGNQGGPDRTFPQGLCGLRGRTLGSSLAPSQGLTVL